MHTPSKKIKSRASVLISAMAIIGLTFSGPAGALTGVLEGPSEPPMDIEHNIQDLLGTSLATAPVPGLTIRQIGVDASEPVEIVDFVEKPLASIWIVNISFAGTFGHVPIIIAGSNFPFNCWDDLGDIPRAIDQMIYDLTGVWFGELKNIGDSVIWPQCEPIAHVADIDRVEDESRDLGLRLCLNQYYIGLDVLPPEGDDNFGTNQARILELRTNFTCE